MQTNTLRGKKQLLIGFTLFSMFFGAGNLIFPPYLGAQAGTRLWLAFAGFAVSAIGLPIAGVVAVARAGGLPQLAERVHPRFAQVFSILVYLSIGPCLAIPRTASTSFAMLEPLAGESTALQWGYSLLFFAVAFLVAQHPEKLTQRLGKILCPALLALILLLFAGCLLHPAAASYGTPTAAYTALPAVQGILDGYQTMDTLAGLNFGAVIALAASLAGCGSSASSVASSASSEAVSSVAESAVSEAASESAAASSARALEDGTYTAEFDTDSSMFHVNEASDGKGTLTVEDGQMTLHISLQSKKIVNLYVGMAADAPDHEADWLQPTTDTVTYSDGTSEEVYGFDVPVEALDTDFQLAILGTKGKWYDHTVSVRNVEAQAAEAVETPADGSYTCEVTLEGGSGRATVDSPAALTVADGKMTATIVWSSPNYDYMIVDGEKYLPTNTEGNSTFEIPVSALGTPLSVVADTVAMSTPHEIEYTLTFSAPSEN